VTWAVIAAVLLSTAGLLVLGVLGARLWLDTHRLARAVSAASRALAEAAEEIPVRG
jgi:hypothetical protein